MTKLTEERIAQLLKIESVAMEVTRSCTAIALTNLHDILKPLEPKTRLGYTEEEWKIIAKSYKVKSIRQGSSTHQLTELDFNSAKPFYYNSMWNDVCYLYRELGHIQPHFPRRGKPDIPDDALVWVYYKNGNSIQSTARGALWNGVTKAFIQLTEGTQDVNNTSRSKHNE